jgi:two-component system LytT family response regulator
VSAVLRVLVADDERPARAFLISLLRTWPDVELVGEAEAGTEAVELIERERPDLALLDLQMPELDGLGVVRMVRRDCMPLVAFVTAYDAYAVRAFELNAIDYLLKPVEAGRLRLTLTRAQERLEQADYRDTEVQRLKVAATVLESLGPATVYLRRIPVRKRDAIVIVPVEQIAAVVAHGELLRITTIANERHTITYRLKDLEARLDPARFVRLSRGSLVNVDLIQKISPMPGGTFLVTLRNNLQLPVSRLRARVLRDELLRL